MSVGSLLGGHPILRMGKALKVGAAWKYCTCRLRSVQVYAAGWFKAMRVGPVCRRALYRRGEHAGGAQAQEGSGPALV
jgi:hypothetical protein